jgi:vacuolar iron transporter family protein
MKHKAVLLDDHTPAAIRIRLGGTPRHSYLRDYVYGAIDGLVTTFAIVSGVAGAGLSIGIIIILGTANLIADGFSMAVSNYLASKAEIQRRDHIRSEELRHVEHVPEGEREEIRQIYTRKGFQGEQLENIVHVITSDQDQWIDTMLAEEHGLPADTQSPSHAALATFIAFVMVGAIPLLAFIWNLLGPQPITRPFLVSSIATGLAFFAVGAAKARFVSTSWFHSGLESLLMGGAAAALAYAVGRLLNQLA